MGLPPASSFCRQVLSCLTGGAAGPDSGRPGSLEPTLSVGSCLSTGVATHQAYCPEPQTLLHYTQVSSSQALGERPLMWRLGATSIHIAWPQHTDLEPLENVDDFVDDVASLLRSHTSPSSPIRTPTD